MKIKFDKIKKFFEKLPKILGKHAFLTFLFLLFLALIFGGFMYYNYGILIQKFEPKISKKPVQFKEKTFQQVLKTWQEREKRFQQTDLKTYPNPFR